MIGSKKKKTEYKPVKQKVVYITGIAGMIGFHTAIALKKEGYKVVGCDNFNDYYDVNLKRHRQRILESYDISTQELDIRNIDRTVFLKNAYIFGESGAVDAVIHLAAYANPRHSMEYPQLYIDTNITGTQAVIDAAEGAGVESVIYASSSCVMHGQPLPWNEHDKPDHQACPYGWSKRTNECQFMHSKIRRTDGLRFFTVYGPYGRPDMALFLFTQGIIDGKPITAFNNGNMIRDFTYVDDIVESVKRLTGLTIDEAGGRYHEIYNIGRGEQVQLMDFIKHIEKKVGKEAIIDFKPAHPADVPATWADTSKLEARTGYKPQVSIEEGVDKFVDWYRSYYHV